MNDVYFNNLNTIQKARWMSLLMAIDEIDHHCEKKNREFDEDMLKPIPIKHYMELKTNEIAYELNRENHIKAKRFELSKKSNTTLLKNVLMALPNNTH